MLCPESLKLEGVYRQRYEQARRVQNGGLSVALPGKSTGVNHAMHVRQLRAQQTQAAGAILLHQRTCPVCGNEQTMPQSLAS